MHRTFGALTLAGTLALASLGEAGSRPRPTPPAPPTPTISNEEHLCWAYGQFALARGRDRDNGFSLVYILSRSRAYDRAQGTEARVTALHDEIIRTVYALPSLPPPVLMQQTESVCLEAMRTAPAASATAKDRY